MPQCPQNPRFILPWILPQEDTQLLLDTGLGGAPDLIYARGIPASINPETTPFDKTKCSLVVVEVGFYQDWSYHKKIQE